MGDEGCDAMSTRFSIVGMNHRNTEVVVDALAVGTVLTLVREPTNKYDPNAVMVWADGIHIGYIPKTQNKPLAALIDSKGRRWTASAEVLALDGTGLESATVYLALDAKFVRSPNSAYPMAEIGP